MNLVRLCNPSHEYNVEVALFKLAQRNAILEVLAPIVMPLVIYLSFGETLDTHGFALWLLCLLLPITTGLLTYRVLHPRDKLATPSVEHLRTWRKRHALYSIAAGIGWGAIGFLFDGIHANQNTAMFVTYLAVVTIGGNASGVHSFRAYFIAVAISMVLIMATLPNAYGAEALPMSIIMAVYPFFLARISINSRATILRMIELQIENEQLLQDKAVAMQLAERERIYRDLHDDVGAKLLGLAISAQRANQPREAELARSALQDLRDVVSRSAHSTILLCDLIVDLRAEAQQRIHASGLQMDWQSPFIDSEIQISSEVALHLSRILREAVTNVLRHADAQRITLSAKIENGGLMLEVADDGKGCPATTIKQHRGMKGMHARALVLNASLHWENADPHGCRVRLVVPLRSLSGEIAG